MIMTYLDITGVNEAIEDKSRLIWTDSFIACRGVILADFAGDYPLAILPKNVSKTIKNRVNPRDLLSLESFVQAHFEVSEYHTGVFSYYGNAQLVVDMNHPSNTLKLPGCFLQGEGIYDGNVLVVVSFATPEEIKKSYEKTIDKKIRDRIKKIEPDFKQKHPMLDFYLFADCDFPMMAHFGQVMVRLSDSALKFEEIKDLLYATKTQAYSRNEADNPISRSHPLTME